MNVKTSIQKTFYGSWKCVVFEVVLLVIYLLNTDVLFLICTTPVC